MKGSITKHGQDDASSKKRIIIAGTAMAVLGLAYFGTTYYDDIAITLGLEEPSARVTIYKDQNITKGAKKGVHFIEKKGMKEDKNSVTDFRQFDKWFISDTQVEVRSGWFHTESLIKATKEILHKQKYWGRFLESVSFVKPNENRKGYFEISVGS